MKKISVWMMGALFLLACQTGTQIAYTPEEVSALPPAASTPLDASIETQTATPTPSPTFSPVPTITNSPTPTPVLIHQGPDAVIVPILLYHHVAPPKNDNSYYYVAPEDFDEQMKLLRDWEYTTITLDLLIKAIKEGADLPARPIIITFDDGQLSVYTTAFPIMQKYGFTGIVYVVGNYMDAPTFMTADQIKELTFAGWEVGSHGLKHKDLTTLDVKEQKREIFESRKLLSAKIGAPINSFAYPWGFVNEDVFTHVHNAGYTSAMGVGFTHDQGTWNLFRLQRRDILGNYDLKKFAAFLPWRGDPDFLPTDTPTPTPTLTKTPRPTKTP